MNTSTSSTVSVEPSLRSLFMPCVRSALWLALITGFAYPLVTTGVAQIAFPDQASGSLLHHNGKAVGSQLIGQYFTSEKYFHSRPSATTGPDPENPGQTISQPYNASSSLGSNQGPTNPALMTAVKQRVEAYRQLNAVPESELVPVDAVTASASGLDPHISLANAQLQLARVAKARGMSVEQINQVVRQSQEGRLLGLIGEPRINVLKLNMALDADNPSPSRISEE